MKAKSAPITIPYHLRPRPKAAGNSEPMLAQSATMDMNGNHLDNSSHTPSQDIDGESLDHLALTPSPDIKGKSLDHLTSSPNVNEKSLDPFRTPPLRNLSPDNYEPFDNAVLDEGTRKVIDLTSSPLSDFSYILPTFSSFSPNRSPLRTIDEDRVVDFNNLTQSTSPPLLPLRTIDEDRVTDFNNLTHSNSPNLLPLCAEDNDIKDIDNHHPTSPDGSNLENDLASPTPSEIRTAEAICQLKNHQSYVEPMNSTSHGPQRNPWPAEHSYGLQTRQPTPHPVLAQSIDFANPAAGNYGIYSFYGNSSQAFPWSAEAFEKRFPRPGFQIRPVTQSYEAHNQHGSQYLQPQPIVQSHAAYQYSSPLAGLQTPPIIQTYEDQNQYGFQYGQPQYGRPQYVQPRTLELFEAQQDSISQDTAAAHHPQANTSRKRKCSNERDTLTKRKSSDETDTPSKRRRGQFAPPHHHPPATISEDELQRLSIHLFHTDPWGWSVSDVYFSLTNTRSHDLLYNNNNTLPHPHLGLILSKLMIDGPKLLMSLTQPFLVGLGITRPDHLAATVSLLDKIRARSPTYQHYRHHPFNLIPMTSLQALGPQSTESKAAIHESIRRDIASKPLKDGEIRRYHFVFGCYFASEGQHLRFNDVDECLGMEPRRESMVSQESDQQQQRHQHRDSMFSVSSFEHHQRDEQHRTSVSFVRGPSHGGGD
ncbi:hypothetical protein JMJ35_006433 [Cladonia borealis]|uniref:Uncharacterized protein n=1 Tax=Cladonia borealis TaxID=184061 RepID=A0AA39U8Z8_9LECA|nr:hypothetical protein JMJ35_006433 [Cladonia borealis]